MLHILNKSDTIRQLSKTTLRLNLTKHTMMKNKNSSFLFILLITCFIIFLGACKPLSSNLEISSTSEQVTSTPFPLPETGKATLIGRVLSTTTGEPLPNMLIRLARVYREDDKAAFVLEDAFSPGGMTDAEGYFTIPNIDPIEYVIVVGDVYSDYKIIEGKDGRAQPWATSEGEILDVGELKVDLP